MIELVFGRIISGDGKSWRLGLDGYMEDAVPSHTLDRLSVLETLSRALYHIAEGWHAYLSTSGKDLTFRYPVDFSLNDLYSLAPKESVSQENGPAHISRPLIWKSRRPSHSTSATPPYPRTVHPHPHPHLQPVQPHFSPTPPIPSRDFHTASSTPLKPTTENHENIQPTYPCRPRQPRICTSFRLIVSIAKPAMQNTQTAYCGIRPKERYLVGLTAITKALISAVDLTFLV